MSHQGSGWSWAAYRTHGHLQFPGPGGFELSRLRERSDGALVAAALMWACGQQFRRVVSQYPMSASGTHRLRRPVRKHFRSWTFARSAAEIPVIFSLTLTRRRVGRGLFFDRCPYRADPCCSGGMILTTSPQMRALILIGRVSVLVYATCFLMAGRPKRLRCGCWTAELRGA